VPLDDRGQRGLVVGVDVVVGDADAVVRVEVRTGSGEEELHERVRTAAEDDRPEDADALDAPHEQVDEAEGDDGLARPALRRGHVDRSGSVDGAGHPRSLRRRARSVPGPRDQHSTTFTASPPSEVSLYFTCMSAPMSRIVAITWSRDTTWDPSPWRAMRAAVIAFTAARALRSMQGTWTRPATGSQVRPRLC